MIDLFKLLPGCLFVLCLLLHPLLLLLSETIDLFDHSALLGGSMVPVICLQLSDLVHGHLTVVALLFDVAHQLVLVHSIELVFDLNV